MRFWRVGKKHPKLKSKLEIKYWVLTWTRPVRNTLLRPTFHTVRKPPAGQWLTPPKMGSALLGITQANHQGNTQRPQHVTDTGQDFIQRWEEMQNAITVKHPARHWAWDIKAWVTEVNRSADIFTPKVNLSWQFPLMLRLVLKIGHCWLVADAKSVDLF